MASVEYFVRVYHYTITEYNEGFITAALPPITVLYNNGPSRNHLMSHCHPASNLTSYSIPTMVWRALQRAKGRKSHTYKHDIKQTWPMSPVQACA